MFIPLAHHDPSWIALGLLIGVGIGIALAFWFINFRTRD
jgi:hypothetical protein